MRRLEALRALGARIAIDDFGSGYSSLGRIGQLPVDIIKVDKSFVDGLRDEQAGMAMVSTIVDLARLLGLSTVAEGVEDQGQCVRGRTCRLPVPSGLLIRKAHDGGPAGGRR